MSSSSTITRKKRLLCSAEQLGVGADRSAFVGTMCAPFQRMIEPAGRSFEQFACQAAAPEAAEPARDDDEDPPDNPISIFFAKLAAASAPPEEKAASKKSRRAAQQAAQAPPAAASAPPRGGPSPAPPGAAGGPAGSSQQQQHAPLFGSWKSIIKDGVDLYEILEVGHLGELATPDEIRKAYRRLALKYHPDKRTGEMAANAEEITKKFRQINEAFNVLSDPFLRRQYDSVQPFDDRIPTERQAADAVELAEGATLAGPHLLKAWENFFRLFDPVFRRNARWSVERPVPSIGEVNSPRADVERFYSFWRTFRSWREFPSEEEMNISEASSRDERRWMERQNLRLRSKPRRLEYQRIAKLVVSFTKMSITFYSLPDSIACDKMRGVLKKSGFPYREVLMSPDEQDPARQELLEKTGYKEMPVVELDGEFFNGLDLALQVLKDRFSSTTVV